MSDDHIDLTFGQLLQAAIDPRRAAALHVAPSVLQLPAQGAIVALPTFSQHAISADDPASGVSESVGVPTWLTGPDTAPFTSRMRFVPVTSKEGTVPFGKNLPQAAVTSEHGSSPFTQGVDPALGESPYELKYIEARTSISNLTILQSEPGTLESVESALRDASRDVLIGQLLTGEGGSIGATKQFQGLETLTLHADNQDTYVANMTIDSQRIKSAEQTLEDGGARRGDLVWIFGGTLHAAIESAVLDPGSGEFLSNDGRMFSDVDSVRSSALDADTGILLDVRAALVLPTSAENQLYVNRVSKPGTSLLTMRTHVGEVWLRPSLVYRITAA